MKRMIATLLVAMILAGVAPRHVTAAPAKEACLVCKVTKGEAEEEPVKAARRYEGKEYGFCSEKCAKAFMSDPAAFVPPTFPRSAPRFTLKDLAGSAVSNESLKGKVVLLDFWATWCKPCRRAIPELQALHEKFVRRGFSVVGVSIDEGDPARVKRFVTSKKIAYPVAVDSEKEPAWDAFHVKAVPAAYLIDREGRIVAQWTGTPANAKDLEAKLEELLRTD